MSSNLNSMDNSDSGGVGAKKGFLYQDYAAALYVITMIRDKKIKAVRFEVTDDIDIIYDDYIEYVQVKTTESDKKWGVLEFCTTSTAKKAPGKRSIKPTDSILHKSLGCDKHKNLTAKFRILTPRDVKADLTYLTIDYSARILKEGRDKLLKSLTNKIKDFKSENGNDINYWIDNAIWEVKSSKEELILKACNEIMKAAADLNIYLDANRDPNMILNVVLADVTNKSAISKKTNVASDKTCSREDFLLWFEDEINIIESKSKNYIKVYSRSENKLKEIFLELVTLSNKKDKKKSGLGLKQSYHLGKYRFDYIAQTLVKWLPELLLFPNEIADIGAINLVEKNNLLASRLENNKEDFEIFIGRLLLHATIRFYSKSQPIIASLFIDNGNSSFDEFENIHIVKNKHVEDELWMGFSKLTTSSNIEKQINEICQELDLLITNSFDKQKEKILTVKEDSYLFSHNINEMLSPSSSLDDYIDRFKFVIFLGYSSDHLDIDNANGTMPKNFEDILIEEVKNYFDLQIDKLIETNIFFKKLNFQVYIYPTPCVNTMLKTIKKELKGNINGK